MRTRRAFTLIEVLVVMSLLGVLFGLSIGLVAKAGRGNALVQAANSFAGQVASARAQSYGSDTAYVKLDADADGGTVIRSFRQRQVFHCPFEDLASASEDVMVREGNITIADGPRPSGEGRHAAFAGSGKINLGTPPWLQFRDGFSIKCMVNPDPESDQTSIELFKKGNAFVITLRRSERGDYDIRCKLKLVEDPTTGQKGGDYVLTTGWREAAETPEWAGPILPGRWQSLAIAYDRNRLTIHVNERLRGVRSEKNGAMRLETEAPFVLGAGYVGGFDSLLISGIFEDNDDRVTLPGTVLWVKEDGTPYVNKALDIHFRNRGLDPGKHAKPIDITFKLNGEAGAKRIVHVAVSGEPTVRTP